MLLQVSEKVGKSMEKGLPKSMKFGPKWSQGAEGSIVSGSRVDFGAIGKMLFF